MSENITVQWLNAIWNGILKFQEIFFFNTWAGHATMVAWSLSLRFTLCWVFRCPLKAFIEQLLLLNRAVATVPSLVKIVWRKLPCEPARTVSLSVISFLDSKSLAKWNTGNFCFRNPKSWALKSVIQLKESGIHWRLESEIHASLTKNRKFSTWNPKCIAWNPESKIPLQTFTWGSLLLMNFKHISDRWTDHVLTERQDGTVGSDKEKLERRGK